MLPQAVLLQNSGSLPHHGRPPCKHLFVSHSVRHFNVSLIQVARLRGEQGPAPQRAAVRHPRPGIGKQIDELEPLSAVSEA